MKSMAAHSEHRSDCLRRSFGGHHPIPGMCALSLILLVIGGRRGDKRSDIANSRRKDPYISTRFNSVRSVWQILLDRLKISIGEAYRVRVWVLQSLVRERRVVSCRVQMPVSRRSFRHAR